MSPRRWIVAVLVVIALVAGFSPGPIGRARDYVAASLAMDVGAPSPSRGRPNTSSTSRCGKTACSYKPSLRTAWSTTPSSYSRDETVSDLANGETP
jgi:hypothetical protein